MKKYFCILLACILILSVLTACGAGSSSPSAPAPAAATESTQVQQTETNHAPETQEESYTIRIASTTGSAQFEANETPMAISVNYFMKAMEEQSGGRIKCVLYPDGQLGSSSDEVIGAVQSGATELTILSNGGWGDYTSAFAPINVPFLFPSSEVAYAVIDSEEFGNRMSKQCFEDVGVYPLAQIDFGFREMANNKHPIHTPADCKGLKIRTQSDPIQIEAIKDLGCSVVSIAYAELYTSLQQGVIDGQENPITNLVGAKLYEQQKYVTLTNHNYTTSVLAANAAWFDSLSDADQVLIKQVAYDAMVLGREALQSTVANYIEFLNENGIEIYEPTPEELALFREAAQPSWELCKDLMGDEYFNELVAFVDSLY